MRLILASSSKNRQNILKNIGWKYEVVKSTVEEESNATDSREYVMDLSRDKANSVASQIDGQALIISADSVVYMDGKIFEKPKSKEEAFNNIKLMSGKVVYLNTGMTIKDLYKNKEVTFSDVVEVHLREVDDEDIKWYVENEKNVLNGCGFTIPGKAEIFLDKIVGDFNTMFGISPSCIYYKLKELGYSMKDFEMAE
ncbi:MAG: septum formation protein Maf [Clostridia bacterium]|nr:septum formation protein Maf [Clostridia bacterium]